MPSLASLSGFLALPFMDSLPKNGIVCSYTRNGRDYLATLDTTTKALDDIELPFTAISQVRVAGDRVVFIGASSIEPTSIVSLNLATKELEVLRRSREAAVDAGYLADPRAIEFPTEGGLTAYGYFYPPRNQDYTAPTNEKPPLIVMSHGGPTSASSASLKYAVQYWTSRGIAVLDVNYGGSSGYGRAYRERLKGRWGIVDVDDCVNGARYLVERGDVDGNRLAIRGGSAGGYTTLCALTFRNFFKAGASHYGISDLEALARDTHKFESRYLDSLIGPYPGTARSLRGTLADSFYRPLVLSDDSLPGLGGQSCSAQSSRKDGRGSARQEPTGRLSYFRRRAARLSQS